MDPALRPVSTSPFPWGRLGLVGGLVFGGGTAVLWFFAMRVTAVVAPSEIVSVSLPTVAPVTPLLVEVPAAGRVSAFAPIDVPWPPGPRLATGRSTGSLGSSETGDSTLSPEQADAFFGGALRPCSPTRTIMGKAITWTCEGAREESRAHIVPSSTSTGTWLRTSRHHFTLPTDRVVESRGAESCGRMLRFVALPEGARVSSSGGSNDVGSCTFDVEGRPERAWETMLTNIFRPGTNVWKRALDDGELSRWTAEAWDRDSWWRLDVVTASVDAKRARVHVQRWAPDSTPWMPPIDFDDKIAALEGCWEPCALALRTRVGTDEDAREQHRLQERELDNDLVRCLYECKGTEQAPARTEPADAN